MSSGVTNKGKIKILEMAVRNTYDTAAMDTSAAQYFMALVTSAVSISATTTTFDTAVEIDPDSGGGYVTGGKAINRDDTDWDFLSDTASGNIGKIQLKDIVWTASGSSLPQTGTGALYALLLDDNATVGSRDVLAWFDLSQARAIGAGSTLTLQNIEIRLT